MMFALLEFGQACGWFRRTI